MTRFRLTLALLLISLSLGAIRNWQTYTNTTHVADAAVQDNLIWIATWGGLVSLDPATGAFTQTLTNVDGLDEQDVRALDAVDNVLNIGTAGSGVDRLRDDDFLVALNNSTGLENEKVRDIAHLDSLLFVATKGGVAAFMLSDEYPFPFLIDNFTEDDMLSYNDILSLGVTSDGYLLCQHVAGADYVHTDSLLVASAWHHLWPASLASSLDGTVIGMMYVRGNKVVFATDHGVLQMNDFPATNDFTLYDTQWGLECDDVNPVYLDDDGNIWLSYGSWDRDALKMIDRDTLSAITCISPTGEKTTWACPDDIATAAIMGFLQADGDLWAYTWGEGLFRLSDNTWTQYAPQCMTANTVTVMTVDQDGCLWTANGYVGYVPTTTGTRGVSVYDYDNDSWQSFKVENSPLHSNNIDALAVDQNNRIWMGSYGPIDSEGWTGGISVYNKSTSNWLWMYSSYGGLPNAYISAITRDDRNIASGPRMWVSCYALSGGGVCAFNSSNVVMENIMVPWEGEGFQNTIKIYVDDEVMVLGAYYDGAIIWSDISVLPSTTSEDNWVYPPFNDLHTAGYVNGITLQKDDWSREWWIAASSGLFAYDGEDWHKLDIDYKRYYWSTTTNTWEVETKYYTDEPRLYGAEVTVPTALLTDPFGRVWIGTQSNGLTSYDPYTDRYTSYNMSNVPLVSNTITSLAYEPRTGRLYIGTPDGLNSVEIGKSEKTQTHLNDLLVYPNPFHPGNGEWLTIANGEEGSMPIGEWECRIYDISGELVLKMVEDNYYQFTWDGTNAKGRDCSSGIYYYVIYDGDGNTHKGTIALIR